LKNHTLARLDEESELRNRLLRHCRLRVGDVWQDPLRGHRVGCLDAANPSDVAKLTDSSKVSLAVQDPPYNLVAFPKKTIAEYVNWSQEWVRATESVMLADSSLYVWLGADQNDGFQPLPDFMVMMRSLGTFSPRAFITMRNQRGYGTQKNWMAVRQELLYYVKGSPQFHVQYTDIPKVLKGYYKVVNGKRTENMERSKSDCIRAGNVWVDVQQVFYRLRENVNGCYAQKPLKSIERILAASSKEGECVLDSFAHSGTTLIAAERMGRRCFTCDIDPVFAEITIRRLEHFRCTARTGWQNSNPFAAELGCDQGAPPALFDVTSR